MILTTNKEDMYLKAHDMLGTEFFVYCYGSREQKCLGDLGKKKVEFKEDNIAFQRIGQEDLRTHVVIASYYDLIRANGDESVTEVDGMFETIYCDEGHTIRFCEITKRGQLLLRVNAPYRCVVTGTPVVGTLSDSRGYVAFFTRLHRLLSAATSPSLSASKSRQSTATPMSAGM